MFTQLVECALTARSQLETGWGPRPAADAGEVAVTDAMPTAAVAMATIAPIRRLLFIPIPPVTDDVRRSGVAADKKDTKGMADLSAAFNVCFGRTYTFLYKMFSRRGPKR